MLQKYNKSLAKEGPSTLCKAMLVVSPMAIIQFACPSPSVINLTHVSRSLMLQCRARSQIQNFNLLVLCIFKLSCCSGSTHNMFPTWPANVESICCQKCASVLLLVYDCRGALMYVRLLSLDEIYASIILGIIGI